MDHRSPLDPEPGLAERYGIGPPLTLLPVGRTEEAGDGAGGRGPETSPPNCHRLALGPALLLPGGQGLFDLQGRRLEATCLRRGADLERFPFPQPEWIDRSELAAAVAAAVPVAVAALVGAVAVPVGVVTSVVAAAAFKTPEGPAASTAAPAVPPGDGASRCEATRRVLA